MGKFFNEEESMKNGRGRKGERGLGEERVEWRFAWELVGRGEEEGGGVE